MQTGSPSRARRRRALRWCAAAGVAAVSTLAFAGPTQADAAFTLTASADGVSFSIANQSFPLVQSVQANSPTAQATLNSRGQATSYSAAPDPGQSTAYLPTTVAGILCASVPVPLPGCSTVAAAIPSYPFAYAQAGDQPQDKGFGAAHLHAEATDRSSEAQTVVGVGGAASATSLARTVSNSDGSVDALADTSVNSLEIGSSVRLTGVRATASIHHGTDGAFKPSSTFEIGHLSVGGLEVGYDNGSFVLLGSVMPLPVPTQAVLDAFKGLGITATFLPALKTPTGITSEGLMLSYQAPGAPPGVVPPLPALLPVGVGVPTTPTTFTYVLGRASVNGSYQTIPGGGGGLIGGTDGGTGTGTGTTGGGSTSSGTGGDTGTTAPGGSTGSGSGPTLTPDTGSGSGGSTPGPQVAPNGSGGSGGGSGTTPLAASPRAAVTGDSTDIYLAFVITALAVFGGASAIRFLGVRLSWTS